jgi:hypothetical protein
MKLGRFGMATAALMGALIVSCGGNDETDVPNGGEGGTTVDAAAGGTAGQGGTAGKGGTAGASGKAGAAGTGGAAGKAGSGGTAGKGGSAGATGGAAGQAAGGSAGDGGTAGQAGDAGNAGEGGAAGDGGTGGGSGGTAGTAGAGGCGECDDGLWCNGLETCVNDVCLPGTPPDCADAIPCTTDVCDEANNTCLNQGNDASCQDGNVCNGVETCDVLLGCKPGTPLTCNDAVACTADTCEPLSGCVFTAVDSICSDGKFCNGPEKCDGVLGCIPGAPPSCDDQVPCTVDSCNIAFDQCTHTADNSKCQDSFYCNGAEICDAVQGCKPGAPACAPDNIACTVDCSETTQSCAYTPDHSKCGPGQFCVPAQNGCVAGTACTVLDPQNPANNTCNDGKQCNGVEMCVNGLCASGTPKDCADAFLCTDDSCDDTLGCVHTPKNSVCDDGDFCTGAETCSATAGCVPGTPPDCSDGKACTADSCSTSEAACKHFPDNTLCSDNKFCNGVEVCDAVTGTCKPGTPVVCPDDGVACTVAQCDQAQNKCVNVPDDSKCACGQTCQPPGGCTTACTQVACSGKVYECGDCVDNDGDCAVDHKDTMCLGPCDNTEGGLWGGIPGQNKNPCAQDCYFDNDSGAGNDNCYWDHACDPLQAGTPPYPEEKCKYDPNAIGGSSCPTAQSATCLSVCMPLTPNGCDCFGCCELPAGTNHWVWLGSITYASKTQECTLADINDPVKCHPCTPVQNCLNTCAHCELCLGKETLPPDCPVQQCGDNVQPCGQSGQAACPNLYYCINGCCQKTLQ